MCDSVKGVLSSPVFYRFDLKRYGTWQTFEYFNSKTLNIILSGVHIKAFAQDVGDDDAVLAKQSAPPWIQGSEFCKNSDPIF